MEQTDFATTAPVLAEAARTVGSPQIRNAGTIGGNLGTGSPAGDTLPVLSGLDATVVLESERGRREASIHEYLTRPKTTAREPDEVIVETRFQPPRGHQESSRSVFATQ